MTASGQEKKFDTNSPAVAEGSFFAGNFLLPSKGVGMYISAHFHYFMLRYANWLYTRGGWCECSQLTLSDKRNTNIF